MIAVAYCSYTLNNEVSPIFVGSNELLLILSPRFHLRLRTYAPCGAVPNDEWRISSVELIPHSAFVIPQWHSRSYPPSPRLPPSLKLWRTSRRDRAIAVPFGPFDFARDRHAQGRKKRPHPPTSYLILHTYSNSFTPVSADRAAARLDARILMTSISFELPFPDLPLASRS